ncbi:hypothetical protein [Hyalangium gracile]|uniref:hypothetical protein n=1 Tax=Hyalangium gracile TaxID=394092 RepID=UPI001CCBA669|nr:hypothetical protein [Hyalangium gracile]
MSSLYTGVSRSWNRAVSLGLILAGELLTACGEAQEANTPEDSGRMCEQSWPRGQQLGTALGDEALALGAGKDGELYVVGYEGAVLGESNLGPSGDAQGFVMRLATDGRVEWKRALGTVGTDTVEALEMAPEGRGLWVAGRTTGAFEGFRSGGQFDGFLASVTSEGEATVLYQWGDARPQHPVRLARTPAGSFVVAGYDDIYVPSNYVESWEDPFVLRISQGADGAWGTDWNRRWDSTHSDWYTGLTVGAAEESYVSGNALSGSARGAFVQRRDERGELAWNLSLSPHPLDTAAKLVALPGGDVLVAGTTYGAVGNLPVRAGQDVYLARLDGATGEARWVSRAGTLEADFVTAMVVDSRGHAFVAGETTGVFEGATGERGSLDAFALEFDANGELLGTWQHGSQGGADDHVADVVVDACGRVFVAGYTEGVFVEGSAPPGGRDAFIVPVSF